MTSVGAKFIKTLGGMMLLTSLAVACNESNFKSDPKTRPLVKKKDADATAPDPQPATPEPITIDPEPAAKLPDSVSQIFPAAVEKDAKFAFSLDTTGGEAAFQLANTTGTIDENRSQISRVNTTNSFNQGTAGTSVTDKFPAVKGIVDIAVVIDNSGSMAEEQANLGTKLNDLLGSIQDVDWRIGVITTSVPGGNQFTNCQLTLIKKSDGGDLSGKFKAAIAAAGISGSGNEQGIAQAVNALNCTTPAWVRSNSTVAVLIVSDEDNCSNGGDAGCFGDETKLIDQVEKTMGRTVGKNAGFFGIFGIPGTTCPTVGSFGAQYLRLMQHKNSSGKNFGSICDASYSSTLQNISDSIAKLLPSSVSLSNTPDANSVVVKIGNNVVSSNDFVVSGQTVTFKAGKEPADGSELSATYSVGAQAFFANDSVTLSSTPAPETIAVRITEKNKATRVMGANEFNANGNSIKFVVKPSELAKIDVDYKIKQDLLTVFKTTQAPVAGTLKVKVAGAFTTAFTFNAAKNEVTLNSAPSDGTAVVLSYTFINGNGLDYLLPTMPGSKNFRILDGSKELTFKQNGNVFSIDNKDFVAGKNLVLKFDIPDGTDRVFNLPADPIDGSESLDAVGSCKLGNGIVLANAKLTANCAVENKTDFVLSYKFLEIQKSYSVDSVPNPDKGVFVVTIDGVPTTNYVRTGSTIVLNTDPAVDSKVGIRYTYPE